MMLLLRVLSCRTPDDGRLAVVERAVDAHIWTRCLGSSDVLEPVSCPGRKKKQKNQTFQSEKVPIYSSRIMVQEKLVTSAFPASARTTASKLKEPHKEGPKVA